MDIEESEGERMTLRDITTIITILKIMIPVIGIVLIILGIKLRKRRKAYIISAFLILLLFGIGYMKHDCKSYIIHNEGIMIREGNSYSSGICMVCNRFLKFKNGELIKEKDK